MANEHPPSPSDEVEEEVTERYDRTSDEGGGISNRPLDEEIENQEALPERGQANGEHGRGQDRGGEGRER